MSDISQISLTQLKIRKTKLAAKMDAMAMELDDLNKEIAARFRCFRALCLSPDGRENRDLVSRRGASEPDAR